MNQLIKVTEKAVCIQDVIISQQFFTFFSSKHKKHDNVSLYPNT